MTTFSAIFQLYLLSGIVASTTISLTEIGTLLLRGPEYIAWLTQAFGESKGRSKWWKTALFLLLAWPLYSYWFIRAGIKRQALLEWMALGAMEAREKAKVKAKEDEEERRRKVAKAEDTAENFGLDRRAVVAAVLGEGPEIRSWVQGPNPNIQLYVLSTKEWGIWVTHALCRTPFVGTAIWRLSGAIPEPLPDPDHIQPTMGHAKRFVEDDREWLCKAHPTDPEHGKESAFNETFRRVLGPPPSE